MEEPAAQFPPNHLLAAAAQFPPNHLLAPSGLRITLLARSTRPHSGNSL
ncbi:MAG: hypothetical protein HYW48_11905 [Deltaproteobacteria bacterium]|nr:hypothetical protein [Deltaproteobacteria bacterium]